MLGANRPRGGKAIAKKVGRENTIGGRKRPRGKLLWGNTREGDKGSCPPS